MKELIFVDTNFLVGLNYPKDQYYEQVKALLLAGEGKWELLITDYIIDEVYTGLLTKAGYFYAMNFDSDLDREVWTVVKINDDYFQKAREVFKRFNKDKEWSFTDCTSYVVMKQLKVKKVLTFDENFGEMGFEVVGR